MKSTLHMREVAGFSLLEVMCAILILGVALAGLTQGITTALSSNKESEVQTVAVLFAAGQIEKLRADGIITDGDTEGDCGTDLAMYRWKQSVTSSSINGLHEVAVAVMDSKSGQTIYELRTMLFDPPPDPDQGKPKPRRDSDRSRKRGSGR